MCSLAPDRQGQVRGEALTEALRRALRALMRSFSSAVRAASETTAFFLVERLLDTHGRSERARNFIFELQNPCGDSFLLGTIADCKCPNIIVFIACSDDNRTRYKLD